MAHERVVELLTSHKVRIARALVRQMRSLSPRYAGLEQGALEGSLLRFVAMTAQFLKTGDNANLREQTLHTAQLRQALGFKADDFMLAGLSFLPVMRRFLLEHASSLPEGIEDYELFEAEAIPLLAESVILFNDASDGLDDDDDDPTVPNVKRASLSRSRSTFSIERVTGSAEDELTPFG
jgi:hypothetical protein